MEANDVRSCKALQDSYKSLVIFGGKNTVPKVVGYFAFLPAEVKWVRISRSNSVPSKGR